MRVTVRGCGAASGSGDKETNLPAAAVTAIAAEDGEARRIALRAAGHLAALADAVQRRLGTLPVAGGGGVFRAPVIWDRFAELTGAARPRASAAVGAALLAALQPAAGVAGVAGVPGRA